MAFVADAKDVLPATHLEKTTSDSDSNGPDGTTDWTPEEERKLVWKVDFRVFPMLCVVFGLSLLDRSNISSAYIAGLGADLGLAIGGRYSIALLVFFIGYGLFEIPSNHVIRRIGARWWLSFLIIAWGCCVLGMGFVHDWKALTVLRAFLGMFEAGLFPGAIYIIGSWYRQYETAKRMSIFYMASLLASGFGPIFAYALSLIRVGGPNSMYRQGWRWIFIIEGVVTILAGLIAPLFLVEFPEKARFLNERQKHIALARVRMESSHVEVRHLTMKESLRTMMDWKLGLYALMYFIAASSVYSMAFFVPIILREGMGFNYMMSQLLVSPTYVFAIIASVAAAFFSDKYKTRWTVLTFQAGIAIVGLLIVLYGQKPGVRYFGLFFANYGTSANVPGTLAYASNQTGKPEKKGVVAAVMISAGALGGVCGSTIFRSQDAPNYFPGMWSTIALLVLYAGIVTGLSMNFKRLNRLADRGERPALEGVEGFRYAP